MVKMAGHTVRGYDLGQENLREVILGGGFNDFLCSPRILGKIPILTHIFPMGWFNHPVVIARRRL